VTTLVPLQLHRLSAILGLLLSMLVDLLSLEVMSLQKDQ
jgi:hypothetical protein